MLYDLPIQIQSLNCSWCREISCDVLRLDKIHSVVSGNKWFKLQHYLRAAREGGYDTLATFGGAWSNHLVATAFACREAGLNSVGIVRGEEPAVMTPALKEASAYGMQLSFTSRENYRHKEELKKLMPGNFFWVDEGGYGPAGMRGAAEILEHAPGNNYTHIICACGTGTTLAGLVLAAEPWQVCIGVSVLKGYSGLENAVLKLLPKSQQERHVVVTHDYHFGGYAKHPVELLEWMNSIWRETRLPTDLVYTAKLVFAVKDMIGKNYFNRGDRLLIIHSGGLQGNRSLPAGTLEF